MTSVTSAPFRTLLGHGTLQPVRALLGHGTLRPAPGALHDAHLVGHDRAHRALVALGRRGNIASGARQEVVSGALAQELSGRVRTLDQIVDPAVGDVTAGAGRGPLVLVSDDHSGRDDPAIRALLARAEALVHTGIRDLPADLALPRVVRTFGGGCASALAGAHTLRCAGGER